MRLEFKPQAFEDLQFWVRTNPKLAKRLLRLIEETVRDPFGGGGKPEPLRGELSGCENDFQNCLVHSEIRKIRVI